MYSCSNPTITDYLKTHSIPNSESYVRYSIERYMRKNVQEEQVNNQSVVKLQRLFCGLTQDQIRLIM